MPTLSEEAEEVWPVTEAASQSGPAAPVQTVGKTAKITMGLIFKGLH